MGLRDFFTSKAQKPLYFIGSKNKPIVTEEFKGTVQTNEIRFPRELGEEHPFDFSITSRVYLNVALVTGAVDKIVDFVWGPGFYTKSKDKRLKTVIDQWLIDVDFDSIGRRWLREALIKGTGFLELGGSQKEAPQGVKLLNSDSMYIQQDKKGNILGYNQYYGKLNFYNPTSVIAFSPEQIAHLPLSQLGDCPYGYGLIWPCMSSINYLLGTEKELHSLVKRKANTPIVAYLGDKESGDLPTEDSISSLQSDLEYMNNKTEWVVSANVKLETLQFGDFAAKFEPVLKHHEDMTMFGLKVPEVIMGRGSIPEGLATVQLDVFERFVKSVQVEVEKVTEKKIFKRILQANNLDGDVEFEWGQPSNAEVNAKVTQINTLLTQPVLSPGLRSELEKKLALLLEIDPNVVDDYDEMARKEREEEAQPRVPGQNESVVHFHEGDLVKYG